ncbi:MAG: histidinol-phosphate transaminase [Thermoprotei archaeon]|nr:histidinol-phosphate transaminase [Thermoprotei archaeon]
MLRSHGGRPPKNVIDFSSPVNPLGPPKALIEIIEKLVGERVYEKYPDYSYAGLKEAIAYYYNLNPENIIPLNGAAEGLNLMLSTLKPKHLITVEPTFGDHRLTSKALGMNWITIPYTLEGVEYKFNPEAFCSLPGELRENSLILMSNPNNPTGSLTRRSLVEALVGCLGRGSTLVIDEAFSEFTRDSESLLGAGFDNIIVLRSFTKIMAIPGLRSGFMYVPNARICGVVDAVRQPWNVNIIVSTALTELLSEKSLLKAFINETVEFIEAERGFLASKIKALGLQVYNSKAPFILIRHGEPHPEFNNKLIARGVYVRDASSFAYLTPYHSRVTVRTRRENLRFLNALGDVVGGY